MSEDQLSNFGVEVISTDDEVEKRPIITSPTDNILIQIALSQVSAEVLFNENLKKFSIIHMIIQC